MKIIKRLLEKHLEIPLKFNFSKNTSTFLSDFRPRGADSAPNSESQSDRILPIKTKSTNSGVKNGKKVIVSKSQFKNKGRSSIQKAAVKKSLELLLKTI